MTRLLALAALLTTTTACMDSAAAPGSAAPAASTGASAKLKDASGKTVATAMAMEHGEGVHIDIKTTAVAAGTHGVHVHTVGKCDGPDFTTAGGHWNPAGKKHGSENPEGPHAGDLPNLTVAADGKGEVSFMLPAGTLAGLLDADGSAIVIHATADDLKSDPAGNSGARIACGVFAAG